MSMKKLIMTLTMMFILTLFAQAVENPVINPSKNIDYMVNSLVNKNWETMTVYVEKGVDSIIKLREEIEKDAESIQNFLIISQKNGNQEVIDEFLEVFSNLDDISKQFIYKEVVEPLIEYDIANGGDSESFVSRASQYLPGYGYTDINYLYKLGRELNSEHVQNFWKEEKRELEENKKHTYYVEMNIATQMSNNSGANGNIEGFNITGSAMINVNGEWKNYAKVEIELKTKVITTALLMYEKRKVTFEVYRAPKGFFSWLFNGLDFDWELHGTCYLFKEFPASTQEIIPPNFLMNL